MPEGEDMVAQAVLQHTPKFELPFPVVAFETDSGNVGIMTDQDGWQFFKSVLEMIGGHGPCNHDH
ncbi:hypothetical protein [Streptomyces sp. NPDC001843]|uniref:hypothetical protein n=1 Tax=Streptomyces sp. NPDC001843 TaxID=3364617 RepID=UPI0036905C57